MYYHLINRPSNLQNTAKFSNFKLLDRLIKNKLLIILIGYLLLV